MKIYLAGGATGNVNKYWRENAYIDTNIPMKIFLAGCPQWKKLGSDEMKMYLAGVQSEKNRANKKNGFDAQISILESFYYVKDWMIPYINNKWDFLLDSGAFTFMNTKKDVNINWVDYVDKYAQFINENDIKLFFELDIDSVVGYEEVKKLTKRLEKKTNRQCIPVWHKSRGLKSWNKLVEQYSYVSIGGIVSGEIKKNEYKYFTEFISIADKKNTKVHALGFTNLIGLTKYPFYSVDSTAWLYGNRGGFLYKFNGTSMEKISKPENTRLKSTEVAIHNFKEWVKFQKYAEIYL